MVAGHSSNLAFQGREAPSCESSGHEPLGVQAPTGCTAPGLGASTPQVGGPACWLLRPGVQGQARPAAPRGLSPPGPRDHRPALLGFAAAPSPTGPKLGDCAPTPRPCPPRRSRAWKWEACLLYHGGGSLGWAAAQCPRVPFEGLSPCARGPGLRDPEPPHPESPALTGAGTQTLADGRPEPPLPWRGPSQSILGTSVGATLDTHEALGGYILNPRVQRFPG